MVLDLNRAAAAKLDIGNGGEMGENHAGREGTI
jgi:hypothetical protein